MCTLEKKHPEAVSGAGGRIMDAQTEDSHFESRLLYLKFMKKIVFACTQIFFTVFKALNWLVIS